MRTGCPQDIQGVTSSVLLFVFQQACLTLGHTSLTFVMWTKHFFESQVRSINKNSPLKSLGSNVTIKQDNTSAIQLERNGWKSSSKRTKHIVVRYFYITDRLQEGDVSVSSVIYKPTEKTTKSDYLTEALQGKLFHIHHRTLMRLEGIDEYMFCKKYKN